MKRQEAPGQLELVRAFVNTRDLERGVDEFTTDEAFAAWLSAHGLIDEGCPVQPGERELALRTREALRELAGGRVAQPAALDEAARSAGVTLGFTLDGTPALISERSGATRAVGTIVALTAAAMFDGTWQRMKVCTARECRWMFYDHSKNRSGTWCQMAECGNRAKVRAFRSRSSGAPASARPAAQDA